MDCFGRREMDVQWVQVTHRACPRAHRLRGVTILIAEDHSDSREALRWHLDEFGATCVESSSGSEAFDAFNRSRPDILLADLWMLDFDGLELIRRIRALPSEHGRLTPAIAVSAQANEEQALMAGYHAVIRKPYDPALVVQMVEEFVRAESSAPSREASWTVSHGPGTVEMTVRGDGDAVLQRGRPVRRLRERHELPDDGAVLPGIDLRSVSEQARLPRERTFVRGGQVPVTQSRALTVGLAERPSR